MTTAQLKEHNAAKRAEKKAAKAGAGGAATQTGDQSGKSTPSTVSDKLLERLNQDEVSFYDKKVKEDFKVAGKFDLELLEEAAQDFLFEYEDAIGTPDEAKKEKQSFKTTQRYKALSQTNADVAEFVASGGIVGDKEAYREFLKGKYSETFEQGRQMAMGIPPTAPPGFLGKVTGAEKVKLDDYTNQAKSILDDKNVSVFVAIDSKHIESVLSDRFMNSTENNKRGVGYESYRHAAELSLGIPGGTPPPAYTRPIYGYVESANNIGNTKSAHKSTDGYGDVKVELKREAFENNSTIYLGDSFSGGGNARKYGADMSDVWANADLNTSPKNVNDLRGGKPYVEAQVYGGVDASKISAIHYPSKASVPDSVRRMAQENQIKIVIQGENDD